MGNDKDKIHVWRPIQGSIVAVRDNNNCCQIVRALAHTDMQAHFVWTGHGQGEIEWTLKAFLEYFKPTRRPFVLPDKRRSLAEVAQREQTRLAENQMGSLGTISLEEPEIVTLTLADGSILKMFRHEENIGDDFDPEWVTEMRIEIRVTDEHRGEAIDWKLIEYSDISYMGLFYLGVIPGKNKLFVRKGLAHSDSQESIYALTKRAKELLGNRIVRTDTMHISNPPFAITPLDGEDLTVYWGDPADCVGLRTSPDEKRVPRVSGPDGVFAKVGDICLCVEERRDDSVRRHRGPVSFTRYIITAHIDPDFTVSPDDEEDEY